MNQIDDLPAPRSLPAHRRHAARSQLEAIVAGHGARRRWTRGRVIVPVVVAIVLSTAAVSVAYLRFQPVTDKSTARCYTVASLAGGDSFSGTTIRPAGTPGSAAQVDNALGVCSDLWRQGFLRLGATSIQRPAPNTTHEVPLLVACTLSNGTAGVFPGDASTCAKLGLPSASG
jgi:hypothetical protein